MSEIFIGEFIGEFCISRTTEGKLWLSKPDGEGMELNAASEEKLAELVSEFWEENF